MHFEQFDDTCWVCILNNLATLVNVWICSKNNNLTTLGDVWLCWKDNNLTTVVDVRGHNSTTLADVWVFPLSNLSTFCDVQIWLLESSEDNCCDVRFAEISVGNRPFWWHWFSQVEYLLASGWWRPVHLQRRTFALDDLHTIWNPELLSRSPPQSTGRRPHCLNVLWVTALLDNKDQV